MSMLLSCRDLGKSYGPRLLFQDISLSIHEGEKIGLIGPNGAGKSTLMKILAGVEEFDTGECNQRKLMRLTYVPQRETFPEGHSAEQVVLDAIAAGPKPAPEGYEAVTQASIALSKVGFTDVDQQANALSGGWRKRLAIACALAQAPDLMLLDEPTNHLDLEGILWLEEFLKAAKFAFILITHDRAFLQRVTTAVMELSRRYPDGLFRVSGNYDKFLEKKDEFLAGQQQQQESLASKVTREEEWLRRGPKARTTKAKGRIQEAERLIQELAQVKQRNREDKTKAGIDFQASGRQTKELVVAEGLSKAMGGETLFHDLSFRLTPGMRLGLLGPNGCGKSTLLRLLSGEWTPDEGKIKRADKLKIVYFEQHRETPDPELTLRRALAPDGDTLTYQGRSIHVNGWARRFLFRDEQLDTKLRLLSGGERARVQIAKLMLQPADLLLLDEPTNDLDIPTLEVLEQNLLDFEGCLVLVTHDRAMLDRVTQLVMGLDPAHGDTLYANFDQWYDAYKAKQKAQKQERKQAVKQHKPAKTKRKGLTYMEKKELEGMEEKILEAETQLEEYQNQVNDPTIAANADKLSESYKALQKAEKEVETLYARWSVLEAKEKGE